jgi:endonuclease/exonuclease/phosphatase family metal-dependent hydrolase
MTTSALIGARTAPDLHVMTFNIRRRMVSMSRPSPDGWSHRRPAIRRLLATEQPALLGVQEALFEQATFVAESLGPQYRRIGRGRNANRRGEGCPMFYDSTRLKLVDWRQHALSDTPDAPGSRSWGNFTPRIVVSASFSDRITGVQFRAFNTHFDNFSRTARTRSAEFLNTLVDASPLPAIVTGDFNTSVGTEPYMVVTSDRLQDAWVSAEERLTDAWGTFPNYRAPQRDRKRIDWILASKTVLVTEAATNPTRYGGVAASDHLPVQAVVRFR